MREVLNVYACKQILPDVEVIRFERISVGPSSGLSVRQVRYGLVINRRLDCRTLESASTAARHQP